MFEICTIIFQKFKLFTSSKAKFAGVGTFFTNRFPSLGIIVDKKVGIR